MRVQFFETLWEQFREQINRLTLGLTLKISRLVYYVVNPIEDDFFEISFSIGRQRLFTIIDVNTLTVIRTRNITTGYLKP